MKKLISLFLFLIILAFACTEDETKSIDPGNTNSNADIVSKNKVKMVSEDATLKVEDAAMRLEMPALRGGNNLFVVHAAPATTNGSRLLVNYAMEYDTRLKASRWSAYRTYKGFSSNDSHWNRNNWDGTEQSKWNGQYWHGDPFQEDKLIPEDYRTTLADHQSNGHDRGHILGSADRLNSKEANGQTFYLSNMHPQLNKFNASGIWYSLENKIRNSWDKDNFRDTLYVVKGGVIDGKVNYVQGKGRPLVNPPYFYMALLCKNKSANQGGYKAIAFWMKHEANTRNDYRSFAISIDELESKTGIDFFCNLPDEIEDLVEKNMAPAAWGI